MPRVVVIAKSVIDQINVGNGGAALAVRNLMREKAQIWMTAGDRALLFRDAEQRMITEIGVLSPIQDANPDRFERQLNPGPHAADAIPHDSVPTAVLALDKGAEVLSTNRKFTDTFKKVGGKVAPEMARITKTITSIKPGTIDYNIGRRLLGLRKLTFGANGRIITPPNPRPAAVKVGNKTIGHVDPATKAPPMKPVPSGPRTNDNARTTKQITAHKGDPIEAPQEHGPSGAGAAKFQGATLGLKGVNFFIQAINDDKQKQRLAARWLQLQPGVIRELDANPEFGALIMIYYSRGQGDAESAIESVTIFQDIHVAYGWDPDDARLRMANKAYITRAGAGDQIGSNVWYPPGRQVDVMKQSTPWPIAGLATFVPGKEKLTKVKFKIWGGFTDLTFSKEALDVPDGAPLRFFYLQPPDKITYMDWNHKTDTHSVDWELSSDADYVYGLTGMTYMGVPVVKLDTYGPITLVSAAMVWPADNYTRSIFKTTRRTDDGGIISPVTNISLLRWVKPEFIRIMRDRSYGT